VITEPTKEDLMLDLAVSLWLATATVHAMPANGDEQALVLATSTEVPPREAWAAIARALGCRQPEGVALVYLLLAAPGEDGVPIPQAIYSETVDCRTPEAR
jgi:hypothetical protein